MTREEIANKWWNNQDIPMLDLTVAAMKEYAQQEVENALKKAAWTAAYFASYRKEPLEEEILKCYKVK